MVVSDAMVVEALHAWWPGDPQAEYPEYASLDAGVERDWSWSRSA